MTDIEQYILDNDKDSINEYLSVVPVEDFISDIKEIMNSNFYPEKITSDRAVISNAIHYLQKLIEDEE